MGKQVSFSFTPETSQKCPRCGMKKSVNDNGCCKDEQKIIKSEKNQKLNETGFSANQQKKFITLNSVYHSYPVISGNSVSHYQIQFHGPPEFEQFLLYHELPSPDLILCRCGNPP
jgi:hypothetical protein